MNEQKEKIGFKIALECVAFLIAIGLCNSLAFLFCGWAVGLVSIDSVPTGRQDAKLEIRLNSYAVTQTTEQSTAIGESDSNAQ